MLSAAAARRPSRARMSWAPLSSGIRNETSGELLSRDSVALLILAPSHIIRLRAVPRLAASSNRSSLCAKWSLRSGGTVYHIRHVGLARLAQLSDLKYG